jgi:hypothetical protein
VVKMVVGLTYKNEGKLVRGLTQPVVRASCKLSDLEQSGLAPTVRQWPQDDGTFRATESNRILVVTGILENNGREKDRLHRSLAELAAVSVFEVPFVVCRPIVLGMKERGRQTSQNFQRRRTLAVGAIYER